MFGNLTSDQIIDTVRKGEEFYIPFSPQGMSIEKVKDSKVSKASFSDFLRAARRRAFKRNPISPNQADYVNWILYDRITTAAAATWNQITRLFVAPIGSGGKTKVDTNLTQVSALESPQWFNSTGIGIFFNQNAAPIDVFNFMNTEYMEYWVSQKIYAEGPIDQFPQAGGVYTSASLGTMTAAATNYVTAVTNGWPSTHDLWDLRLPMGLGLGRDSSGTPVGADGIIGVTILQTQTFTVQLKADGGGATMAAASAVPIAGVGLTIGVRLHGILSRGVQ